MSAKKPKRPASKKKEKVKDKKNDLTSSEQITETSRPETETQTEHPDYVQPLVLTSATQELFGCRADEDVTAEKPYKLLKKEDIIQDMKTRAAVSDFSPIKQAVLDYPEDEVLLVFDRDFIYGQVFYLVLTPEAKQSMLEPPVVSEEVTDEGEEEFEEEPKSPEPKFWVSLGSEREIEEESSTDIRTRLQYKISRLRREFGSPVRFSDLSAMETKGAYTECTSYQDKNFNIWKLEQNFGTQCVTNTRTSSSQTTWKYPRNMWTQYEPQELSEEEKHNILQSQDLKDFLSSITSRFEVAIQQNVMMDVFVDEVCVLGEDDVHEGKVDTHLKVYQTFTELHYSQNKFISYINWHPTINGIIAVSVTEKLSFEERINSSTKLLLNPPLIIFWSFSDPIHPQLLLECPDDVLCFHFCPSHTAIIVGGCMNGQVVLWDISDHMDRLQGTRIGVRTKVTNATKKMEEKQSSTPVVRYCAVSGIESGHRGPVTDVQWLPENFEVSRLGIPLENKNQLSVQIVSCSTDGCVFFWDLRAPHAGAPNLTEHNGEENALENLHEVPNTFKYLDLIWRPLFKVTFPKIDSAGEYTPLKFTLRDSVCDVTTVDQSEVPAFSALSVPSSKHLHHLETISTKFFIGTEDGELVYTDWKLEKDNETGQLCSPKPISVSRVQDTKINTLLRSPFLKDLVLSVGGWTFTIWKEGVMKGPILRSPCSRCKRMAGVWSPTRPAVFFIGKEDGSLEVWNLLEKTHEPVLNQNISSAPITCIKPWIASLKQHFLAVSDRLGTLYILQVPWTLRQPAPNEEQSMSSYVEREVERLNYTGRRPQERASEKKATEENKKIMRSVKDLDEDQMEELQKEVQKDFEEYFRLEELMIKNMGLLKETQDEEGRS